MAVGLDYCRTVSEQTGKPMVSAIVPAAWRTAPFTAHSPHDCSQAKHRRGHTQYAVNRFHKRGSPGL
jgi:hypothetical protein